jgi:hypothetical protein
MAEIEHGDPSDALEAEEEERPIPELRESDAFRLRALVVAAIVEAVRRVVRVEESGKGRGGDLLERVPGIEYQLSPAAPDGERSAAEGVERVEVAVSPWLVVTFRRPSAEATRSGSNWRGDARLRSVNPSVLNRKIHYWAAVTVAFPMIILIGSGLLLQMKKHWTWVQPKEHQGTGTVPVLDLEGILARVKRVPGMGVSSWNDVNRLDVRPGKGVVKVWLENGHEVQVDLGTGHVLQTAYRRSDLIESIHDGSFFAGNWTKLGLFLPTGMVLFLLWITGLWMFWQPVAARRRRAALTAAKASSAGLGT